MSVERDDDDVNANFKVSVKVAREKRGWNQSELARAMVEAGWESYSQMTVKRTESGERKVRLDEALALARVLETDFSAMIVGVEAASLVELQRSMRELRKVLDLTAEVHEHYKRKRREAIRAVEELRDSETREAIPAEIRPEADRLLAETEDLIRMTVPRYIDEAQGRELTEYPYEVGRPTDSKEASDGEH